MNREVEHSGKNLRFEDLLVAQSLSRTAMDDIANSIKPGMTEADGRDVSMAALKKMGSPRSWHRPVVRFGQNTTYTFSENQKAESVLQANDIFFLDLGPNWIISGVEVEGDVGNTYTLGTSDFFEGLARGAESLYKMGCTHWRDNHATGQSIYAYLDSEARKMGFDFLLNVDGHRLSEFSHQQYFKHGLCEIDFVPQSGKWILEVQLREAKGYGAFYEDLLI